MWEAVDSFLFAGASVSMEEQWRGRALALLSLLVGSAAWPFVLLFAHQQKVVSSAAMAIGGVAVALSPLVLRVSASLDVGGYFMTVAMAVTMVFASIGNGGFWGLCASVNSIIPIFGCFVVGWRCSLNLAFLISAETVAFYFLGRTSIDPDVQKLELIIALSYTVQPFIVAGSSWFIVRLREEMLAEMALAAQRKIRLVGNMSHDIRTPLHGAIGISEMLSDTMLSDVQEELVASLQSTQHSLLDVLNDIITASALDAGVMPVKEKEVDLYKLLRVIGDSMRYAASNKDIGLVILPPHRSGPACGMSDYQILYQILLNLVGNAIKFTSTGLVTLDCRVDVTNAAESKCNVTFEVRDTGVGIEPAFVDQLNRGDAVRFRQSTAGKAFGGSGLGLYIVQGLVSRLQSRLEFESTPGIGTTVRFVLRDILAIYEAPTKLAYTRLRIVGIPEQSHSLAAIDVVASRRWGMTVTMMPKLGPPLGNAAAHTLTMLPCTSEDGDFEILDERNEPYVRLCDCVNSCDVQADGACLLHRAMPVSVFQIRDLLNLGAQNLRSLVRSTSATISHPKATAQGRASFETTRAYLASLGATRRASEVAIPEAAREDMRRMSIVAPGVPVVTGLKTTIAQRKLSSVSSKQTVRVLLVEPMTTQQQLAQALTTKEGIYEVQASSEDMLERHARGASMYHNMAVKPRARHADYTIFVGPEVPHLDVPLIFVPTLKDVPPVLLSIFGGTIASPRVPALESSSSSNSLDDGAARSVIKPAVGSCNVLVADDNAIMRAVLGKQLKALQFDEHRIDFAEGKPGHRVACAPLTRASDGVQALNMYTERAASHYGLLLLDCQMPGMVGPAVVRKVREREAQMDECARHVPAILHSATIMDASALLKCGADDFVEKPFTVDKWRAVLGKWVQWEVVG